jgi:hypothetical protein
MIENRVVAGCLHPPINARIGPVSLAHSGLLFDLTCFGGMGVTSIVAQSFWPSLSQI